MHEDRPDLGAPIAAMDQCIERLRKHVPAGEEATVAAPIAPQPILKCPACGNEMQPGIVSVHGTFWGFLAIGFSHQQCWFEPADGNGEEVVIDSGMAKRGWRCQGCGFVGIGSGEARPSKRGFGDV
jgi:Domain of unknown function (DUF6487)